MTKHEQKVTLKAEIKKTVGHIRELKKIRGTPLQPGWQGGKHGLDLEQSKGIATLLCLARARMRNRRHIMPLPRTLLLPPHASCPAGRVWSIASQAMLDDACDRELCARIPGYEPLPIPEPAVPQEAQAA